MPGPAQASNKEHTYFAEKAANKIINLSIVQREKF